MSNALPKPTPALVGAALSLTLLTGSGCGANLEANDLPEIITPAMTAELTKSCTFYANLLKLADKEHFSGTTRVSQQDIARNAYQEMLRNAFGHIENSGANKLLHADGDEDNIIGLKIGETTISVPETTDQITTYRDHCNYLRDGVVTLAQKTNVSVFRLHEYAVDGAIKASRDPHSTYEWKERADNTRVQTQGEFGGLGIEVRMTDGIVEIISPLKGTPAEQAGVLAGDFITHLNGKPVLGKTLNQAVDIMRGTPGEPITLTIKRGNEEAFDLDITRDIIKVEVVNARIVGQNQDIAHIEVKTFNMHTSVEVIQAINKLKQQQEAGEINEIKELILDFRDNPGGLLRQAEMLSDIFLQKQDGAKNVIVAVGKDANDGVVRVDTASRINFSGFKIKVLINGGSASASEIVAGALKDAGIEVIGTKSYGKGSVQTLFPISADGNESWVRDIGSLRLTTELFFPGNTGLSNYKSGIIPNMMVRFNDSRDDAASESGGESTLDRSGSLVPVEKTRAGNVPDTICSVKAEFSGELSAETLKTLPGELVTSFRIKDAQTGERKSVKGIDATLACALRTSHVTITPYAPQAPQR